MKFFIFAIFLSYTFGQYIPPWVQQYNPYFGGNNPYIPQKNFTNNLYYPSFPPRNNASNGPWFTQFHPAFRGRRAIYYCIPDYHPCNGSHSISIGCLTPMDRVLFQKSFVKPGRWYSSREKIIDYPGYLPPGFARNETIQAIRIYDRDCNGTGGYAQILPGGGVGNKSVRIRLYSDGARKGFKFHVAIYGR